MGYPYVQVSSGPPPTPPKAHPSGGPLNGTGAAKTGRKATGGRPRLGKGKSETKEQKALLNVYTIIQNAGVELAAGALMAHFKSNKDFKDMVAEAGKTYGEKFFRAAISWIKDQKTSSENVS